VAQALDCYRTLATGSGSHLTCESTVLHQPSVLTCCALVRLHLHYCCLRCHVMQVSMKIAGACLCNWIMTAFFY
jgi:hypothetical protein